MRTAGNRITYLDNMRILLASLVILHHTAISQGASGGWLFIEKSAEGVQGLLLTMFTAVNQAFFMGGFFLLAGFFTPPAYDRHGPTGFAAARLIRLGIPLLVYAFVLSPLTYASIWTLAGGFQGSFGEALGMQYRHLNGVSLGPLWFLESLLLFAFAYLVVCVAKGKAPRAHEKLAPHWSRILGFGVLLGVISFLIRLIYPTGTDLPWLNAQPGYYTQYVALFFVGAIAWRRGWLESLPQTERRRWFWVSIGLIVSMPVLVVLGGGLSGDVSPFLGGPTWQAAAYALWDQVLGVSMLVWLLLLFRDRWSAGGRVKAKLSRATYGAYVLHAPIVVLLTLGLRPLVLPPLPKFLVLGSIAVPACFLVAVGLRRLPLVRRVL